MLIYTLNAVLLLTVVIFICVTNMMIVDNASLLPIDFTKDGAVYWTAMCLAIQLGPLQAFASLAAYKQRWSLLQALMAILVVLLIADMGTGVMWTVKIASIFDKFPSHLLQRVEHSYGVLGGKQFTEIWDRIQVEHKCCGVTKNFDFYNSSFSLHDKQTVPITCCVLVNRAYVINQDSPPVPRDKNCTRSYTRGSYKEGCLPYMVTWLRTTGVISYIAGYTLTSFVKAVMLVFTKSTLNMLRETNKAPLPRYSYELWYYSGKSKYE